MCNLCDSHRSTVIALKLQDGKFYIECGKLLYGAKVGPEIQKDMCYNRTLWINDYPIVCTHNVYYCKYPMTESTIIKYYMQRYGIKNVRGGMYYDYTFDYNTYICLHKEIFSGIDFNVNEADEKEYVTTRFKNKTWTQMIMKKIVDALLFIL